MGRIVARSFVVGLIAGGGALLGAAPASATVHPLANSECSSSSASVVAQTQNPPGITSDGHHPGYVDPDPDNAVQAQPVIAILSNSTAQDSAHAFKAPSCPNA